MAQSPSTHSRGLTAPATHLETITPNDAQDLDRVTRAICAGQAGWVSVTMLDGSTGDFYLAAGVILPVQLRRIHATGTTATGLRGLS